MKSNPVIWFEIYVLDLARAQRFYESVLKVKLERLGDPNDQGIHMMAFPMEMERPGAAGTLVKADGIAPGGTGTLVYFNCEDCADEESRVESAGGRIQRKKMAIGEYGFVSLAFDTEGNLFGLHSTR